MGLNEEPKPKKRGLFGFGESKPATSNPESDKTNSGHRSLFTGRKRGQSGQGSELGQMNRPKSSQTVEAQ